MPSANQRRITAQQYHRRPSEETDTNVLERPRTLPRPAYTNRPPRAFTLPLYEEADDYLPSYPQALLDPMPAWTRRERIRVQAPWNHFFVRTHADPFAQAILGSLDRLFSLRRHNLRRIVTGVLALRAALDQDPNNAHLDFSLTVTVRGQVYLIPPHDL
jgi:hypothetical protein